MTHNNKKLIKTAKDGGYDPGGDIMIHGYPNKIPAFLFRFWHKRKDWTAGCIAVTNDEIEEIYDIVKDGTPITILPPKTELRENQIKPICLNDFKNGMERLDVRDFHKKKIWHGFEYFKTDRKKGVKVSIILGYNEGYDNFHIDSFFASLYFKSIESARCPLLNKYHIVGGNTVSTLTHSFMKELEGCELRISQSEHIDFLVNKIQCILNEKIWSYIDQYSNIEEVAKEIASKKLNELPFDFAYAGPQAAAMLFLKQTNNPLYEDKLIETVNHLKQYVIGDVAEHGSLAESSVRVLKMVEEQLHDDLEKVGYEFYKG